MADQSVAASERTKFGASKLKKSNRVVLSP